MLETRYPFSRWRPSRAAGWLLLSPRCPFNLESRWCSRCPLLQTVSCLRDSVCLVAPFYGVSSLAHQLFSVTLSNAQAVGPDAHSLTLPPFFSFASTALFAFRIVHVWLSSTRAGVICVPSETRFLFIYSSCIRLLCHY